MLRVYMDESGTHDDSPVVTVGAYTGRPKTWKNFERDWKVAKRPIEVYHATDCEALHGEFEGWSAEQRNTYVANLLPVLARYELLGNAVGINVRDYDAARQGEFPISGTFGSAYEFCFQVVVDHILWETQKAGMNDMLAFVHEDNDYQQAALAAFEYVKKKYPSFADRMTIAFAPKSRIVPLQAADILAYEANKRLRDQDRPKRRSLLAMDPTGDRVSITGIDKANVKAALDRLEISRKEIALLGRPVNWIRDP